MADDAAETLTLEELVENFEFLDDWTERYRYIIELGRELPALDASQRTDANLVRGCQSQVWLVREPGGDGEPVRFQADSDAHIVRGLVRVLLIAFDGKTPEQIAAVDHEGLFASLGLAQHLSPSRTNGLYAMVQRIRDLGAVA